MKNGIIRTLLTLFRRKPKLIMRAAYHGTTVENAEKILKVGLEEYSYYTPFLDTALAQGGPVIFIWYIMDPQYGKAINKGGWQFRTREVIPPDEFAAVVYYKDVKLIKYNGSLVYRQEKAKNPDTCRYCRGHGDMNYPDDGHCYLPGGSSFKAVHWRIQTCPKCNGHGYRKKA